MSRRSNQRKQVLLGFGTNFFYALGNDESSEDVMLRHDDEPLVNDRPKQKCEEQGVAPQHATAAIKVSQAAKANSARLEGSTERQTTATHTVKARRLHSSFFARNNTSSHEDAPTIQQIVCTAASSVFLTSSGQIYQCGMLHGSIGPSPTKVELHLPLHCTELAAGRHFCLALVEGGVGVCSFGAGHFGQLGHGPHISHLEEPQLILHLLPRALSNRRVTSIAAGTWHAAAISSDGQAFMWGSNRHGQCCCVVSGNDSSNKAPPTLTIPTPVDTEIRFSQMSLGRFHSVGLQKDTGRVFTFGSNYHGQCGHNSSRSGRSSRKVRLVESLQRVCMVQIAAGDLHTLALTGGGRVFSWGCGLDGQLGVVAGNAVWPRSRPRLVHDLDFVAIAAGGEDFQKQQQTIPSGSGCGSGTHPLSTVPRIVTIQAAGNYSVAVSSSGHVYSWGSNDTGALGLPTPEHLELVDPLSMTQEQNMNLLSNKTSGQRTLEAKSFDSTHNVWLPRRVDALSAEYHVEGVAAGPGHLWCWGHKREQGDNIIVGRTLYELQDEKRRKGAEITQMIPLSRQEYRSSMTTETPDGEDEQGQLILEGSNDPTPTPPISSTRSEKGTLPARGAVGRTKTALPVPEEQRPHGNTGLQVGEARVANEDGFVDVGASVSGSSTASSDPAPLATIGRKLSLGNLFGKKKKKSRVPNEEKQIIPEADNRRDSKQHQNAPAPHLVKESQPEPEPELITNLEDSYSC
jgi:alpha-tubulin suppressor-like RCC1 family protein